MSNVQRYRRGPVSEVPSVVKAGVQADVGDLVALNAGKVETFTSMATTAALFQDKFLGVLQQGYTAGTEAADSPCLVYTSGDFEYDLSAAAGAAVDLGGLVAAASDQTVSTGAVIADAIGRLARRVEVGDSRCLVRVESNVFGGPTAVT